MGGGFWQISLGNVLSFAGLMITLIAFHIANVRRIQQSSERFQKMETKMDLVYEWFKENVIGRGEPPRDHRSGGGHGN